MHLLFTEKESEIRLKVTTIHNFPQLLSADDRSKGIEVNDLPIRDMTKGSADLFINPITMEMWYEYRSAPEIEVLRLENENLKQRQNLMQQAIDDLIFGGAF